MAEREEYWGMVMAKITETQIKKCYEAGKGLYLKTIKSDRAIHTLTHDYSMNYASAMFYIYNVGYMLDGKRYSRTMPAWPTEYYLTNIQKDFPDKFHNALSALGQHLDYYQSLKRGAPQKAVRRIFEKYKAQETHEIFESYPEELEENSHWEGAGRKVFVNIYERNLKARKECLKHHKHKCKVCNFDFEKVYGTIGANFIHVHHVVDLSTIKGEYQVDPVKDLIPVCPNCHSMLHRERPAMSVEKLKDIISRNKIT